jgi:hypothetical protein
MSASTPTQRKQYKSPPAAAREGSSVTGAGKGSSRAPERHATLGPIHGLPDHLYHGCEDGFLEGSGGLRGTGSICSFPDRLGRRSEDESLEGVGVLRGAGTPPECSAAPGPPAAPQTTTGSEVLCGAGLLRDFDGKSLYLLQPGGRRNLEFLARRLRVAFRLRPGRGWRGDIGRQAEAFRAAQLLPRRRCSAHGKASGLAKPGPSAHVSMTWFLPNRP